MAREPQSTQAPDSTAPVPSLLHEVCLSSLRSAQNQDGGWPYRTGNSSSVEATCWAVTALANNSHASGTTLQHAHDWLSQTQLPDGSWPALAGQKTGCWATALACRVLHMGGQSPEKVARGVEWICDSRPAEGDLLWRFRAWLSRQPSPVRQDSSLIGWGWTPRTASWVEPTAHSLILLRSLPESLQPKSAPKRRQLGERMLYDRMCRGGGWNSGNPLVYGVAGVPRVIPTVWALFALQDYADRSENREGLDWLAGVYDQIHGPASLALTYLCLRAYGRSTPPIEPDLRVLYESNRFFGDILATAFAAIALGPPVLWAALGRRGEQ